MSYDEIPNGFLNMPRKHSDFESAGDAIRRAQRDAQSGRNSQSIKLAKQGERQSFERGWHVEEDLYRQVEESLAQNRGVIRSVPKNAGIYEFVDMPDVLSSNQTPKFNFNKLEGISADNRRWSWIEIDRNAIHNNIMNIRRALTPGTMFMAVVKADGYGHGAVLCAKTAINAGAEYLGVATVDEAIKLRDAKIDAPILVLSEPPISAIPLLLAYSIQPSVATIDFAEAFNKSAASIGLRAPFHLKINTGMNRMGVRHDHILDFLQRISHLRALDLIGTFTHFASADTRDTFDFNMQRTRFEEAISLMRGAGINPGIVHAANSAATLRFPEAQYDMVRVGLAMYGYFPCEQTVGSVNLMPAMSVHARITLVNDVPVGEGVSYGLVHKANGFSKFCTIPIGYADGLRRGLSGRIHFIKDGKLYPQVGNICMDQCMFEVPLSKHRDSKNAPSVGEHVIVIGASGNSFVTIEQMSDLLNTIPYEIMIGFGTSRLPKIYV